MSLFLTIREGDAEQNSPVFVTSDAELIAEVGRLLARRLGVHAKSDPASGRGTVTSLRAAHRDRGQEPLGE
jgi:hypothetical protein